MIIHQDATPKKSAYLRTLRTRKCSVSLPVPPYLPVAEHVSVPSSISPIPRSGMRKCPDRSFGFGSRTGLKKRFSTTKYPKTTKRAVAPEAAASAVAFLFRLNTDQWRDQSFDYAHDQARRFLHSRGMRLATKDHIELTELKGKCRTTICAICGRVEFIHIALRAYALRLWLRAQTPQLRFGNILSMVNLSFAPAKRLWPEGL